MEVHKDDPTRYRWWSDVNSYHNLDAQIKFGPTYLYEYSTREAYGSGITWGANDPLNATWWHRVTESASPTCLSSSYFSLSNFLFFLPPEMEADTSLVSVRGFPRFSASLFISSCFLLVRRLQISKVNNPCARVRAMLPVQKRRYAICVAARRVSPCRTVKVALVQCSLEHLNFFVAIRFLDLFLPRPSRLL